MQKEITRIETPEHTRILQEVFVIRAIGKLWPADDDKNFKYVGPAGPENAIGWEGKDEPYKAIFFGSYPDAQKFIIEKLNSAYWYQIEKFMTVAIIYKNESGQ